VSEEIKTLKIEHDSLPVAPDPAAIYLYNALNPSGDELANNDLARRAFEQGVDDLVTLVGEADPGRQEKVRVAAEMLDWYHFARPGDPLPPSLIIAATDDSRVLEVVPNPDQYIGPLFLDQVEWFLARRGALPDENVDPGKEQGNFNLNVVREAIHQTPEYALVQSFASEQPHDTQVPLTPQQKRLQKAVIEASVRKKHASEAAQLAMPEVDDPNDQLVLRAEIGRQTSKLDEATMSRKVPQQPNSALKRAASYFQAEAKAVMARTPQSKGLSGGNWKKENRILYRNIARRVAPQASFAGLGFDFMTAYLDILLSSANDPTWQKDSSDYQELIGTAVWKVLDGEHIERIDPQLIIKNYAPWLKNPPGEVHTNVRPPSEPDTNVDKLFNEFARSTITSQAELDRKQQATLGWVTHYNPEAVGKPDALRVIEWVPTSGLPKDMPRQVPDQQADLTLHMTAEDSNYSHQIPTIPGFRLVAASREQQIYQFKALEHDPYQSATVPLPPGNQYTLVNLYEDIGLVSTAQLLRQPSVTLEDLTRALRLTSSYTTDPTAHQSTIVQRKIEDFRDAVIDGRFVTQCDGAALMLKAALGQTYSWPIATRVISGLVFDPSSKRVSAERHAQTMVAHDGTAYILDATPPLSPAGESARSMGRRVGDWRTRRKLAQQQSLLLPGVDEPELLEVESPESAIPRELHDAQVAAAGLSQTVEAFERQLQGRFAVANRSELYKKVLDLHKDDPIRRVMGAVVGGRDPKAELSAEELSSVRSYLNLYEQATPQNIRKTELPVYDKQFLRRMSAIIEQIQAARPPK
jgi:hypothetical protein